MTRTVASLALIKLLWDHWKHDYLEAFVPLVGAVLTAGQYTSLDDTSIHRLCREFETAFGLRLPYHPMIAVLNRARKRGLVTRWQGRFIPVAEKLAEVDLSTKIASQTSALNALLDAFIAFAKEKFGRTLTQATAEEAFVIFLKAHDVEILFAAAEGSALPDAKPSVDAPYLVASFIQRIQHDDPPLFGFVASVAVGHALASAMLYKGIERYAVKLRAVHVYLDTRFVLRLVGAEGPERRLAYYAVVEALRGSEAKLRLFRHTYDELMGILKSCQRWVANPSFDPSKASPALQFFVQSGFTQSDVDDFMIKADEALRDMGVDIVDGPAPSEYIDFQIDETRLRERIVAVYEQSGPFDEAAKAYTLDRDIKSVTAVNKLRRGRRPVSLKQSGHVLVTTNAALAYANRRFEREIGRSEDEIMTCVTDVFLGTTIWLQSPAVVTAISTTRLIAHCTAALQLDHSMLKKLAQLTAKLKGEAKVSDEEYYLLRASPIVRDMLAERTLGDAHAFSARTLDEILKDVKDQARAPEVQRYRRELEEHAETQLRLMASEIRSASVGSKVHDLSSLIARVGANLVFVILLAIAGAGFVVPFFELVERPWVKVFAVIVAIVFGIGSLLYGINLLSARDWVMNKVDALIYEKLTGEALLQKGPRRELRPRNQTRAVD